MIWWLNGSPRLGAGAQKAITSGNPEIFFSAASWWELSLKKSLGRLDIDLVALRTIMHRNEIQLLDVRFDHADAAANVPGELVNDAIES